jgi:hypothetical protein
MSGLLTAPCRHSPTLKAMITAQRNTTATAPFASEPTTRTPRHVPLKIAPAVARARSRLWPPSAFANGSWASTSTSVLTKKIAPIPAPPTAACSFT